MAGNKYLHHSNGVITEQLSADASAGVADAGKIVALDATGKLDATMMPVGIGAEIDLIQASEGLAAGDFVNVYSDAGQPRVNKADASIPGREANGFVLAAVTSGNNASVYRLSQLNNQLSGMTPGAKQYLSTTTPGRTQETAPSGSGEFIQLLGESKSATELSFNPGTIIALA